MVLHASFFFLAQMAEDGKKESMHFEHMLLLSVECVLFGEDTTATQVVIND